MKLNTARALNCFFFITNFLIAIAFLLNGTSQGAANPIVTSIFYLGVVLLEKFSLFKLKNYIRVLLILTMTSHSLLGEYFRAYYQTAFFDNALHLIGSFSFALFAYELLRVFVKMQSSQPELFTFILVSLLGTTLGTFFELGYFLIIMNRWTLMNLE
ncbi:MAG: hypothetical protein ACYC4E_02630 [Carboxydocellales bacterium]